MRSMVDLPLPLPPSTTVISPGAASRSTPFSTPRPPNVFQTPASTATSDGAGATRAATEAVTAGEPNGIGARSLLGLEHARDAAAHAHEQLVGDGAGGLGQLFDGQAIAVGRSTLAEDHDRVADLDG